MSILQLHTMLALISFSLVLTVVLFRLVVHSISARNALRNIPGPVPSSLLWGEEWDLYHKPPGSLYLKWHQRFGKVLKFRGSCGHYVLSITDQRAVSYILGTEGIYKFPKPDGVREWFRRTQGEGIIWTEGKEAHERQRRYLAPAFTQQSVRKFTPIFYEMSAKLAAQWAMLLDSSESKEVEIEITNWAARFALDTVARATFSYDFNLLSGEPNPLAEALDGLTNSENRLSSFYMRALFWIFPSILSLGKKGEMIKRTKAELGAISRRMWQDAKTSDNTQSNDDKTLMSIMLAADRKLDEEEVVAQMRTILSAGYEPVSATVAWVLYELAMNPELQNQLRAEISSHDESPILNSVILETLRLYPPVLENHHQAADDIIVPLSEPIMGTSISQLAIPKGTIVVIPVNVLQTDREIWGEDAHLFRPERWRGRDDRRGLFAFSQGPRACVGKQFALAEIKALVVTLVQQFSFRCPYEIEPFQSFVIRPRVEGQGPSSLPLIVRRV
ncbi:cytochrome P450 [Roridomyces roridus]|uniref:Cytochrome P450 n=1 Tax=Roridomyces roridus TaxID=1738132 RepID=A0AAD7BTJ6_9AGAR|nr:cytochrome P450 [Roridomyces roridus]